MRRCAAPTARAVESLLVQHHGANLSRALFLSRNNKASTSTSTANEHVTSMFYFVSSLWRLRRQFIIQTANTIITLKVKRREAGWTEAVGSAFIVWCGVKNTEILKFHRGRLQEMSRESQTFRNLFFIRKFAILPSPTSPLYEATLSLSSYSRRLHPEALFYSLKNAPSNRISFWPYFR